MAIISEQLFNDLGIELPQEELVRLQEHFDTTLEERIINEVVMSLTAEQAEELASMKEASDEHLLAWLHTNIKDLREIVSDEVDILLGELAEHADAIHTGDDEFTSA